MKFFKEFRAQELMVLLYRLFLAYFFYQIARLLFWFFNRNEIEVAGVSDYLKLAYHGIAFDTTAILYVNSAFILLSIIPLFINTSHKYQKFLFWFYFVSNGLFYALNFIDFVYYKFSKLRLTKAAFQVTENEDNIGKVFFASVQQQPFVLIWFIVLIVFWIWLYKKVNVKERKIENKWGYFILSILSLCLAALLSVGGIRGDFKHSTRPINMIDAAKHVQRPEQANIVLNSVFSFLRTIDFDSFKEVNFVDQEFIDKNVNSYKWYKSETANKPNIVLFIVESFGREYSGAFNKDLGIKDYESFTPFIDSLAQHSLIFTNAYGNGRQSIHAMSSILAGIPALTDAFTGSPYANQEIQSLVSITKEMGYNTSFYHGAPNGSMGYQGFSGILGFDSYFGMTEYNNDQDFDGMWSIWDEPFLQYFAKNSGKKTPFFTTVFTASSHHPFKIPEKYSEKFKKGYNDMHQPIQYTDYSIKKYFETASKQPWFKNTIFVITGDHANQSYYENFSKGINVFALPILIYAPNSELNLKGVDNNFAQQIDIYPTIVDLIGYNKKFRSWGRSLVSDTPESSIIVTSDGLTHGFVIKNYIYAFNGKDFTGIYLNTDRMMLSNLINSIHNPEIERGKALVKAWYQDYMDRIVNKKLN